MKEACFISNYYIICVGLHWIETAVVKNQMACTEGVNIALRRFLHNHGNIGTEGSPKPRLCPTLFLNDFKGSL